jgi:hypothetical protein
VEKPPENTIPKHLYIPKIRAILDIGNDLFDSRKDFPVKIKGLTQKGISKPYLG